MHFEIWKNDKLIKRGKEILNDLSWDHEIMVAPSLDLVLPIEYKEYLSGREEIKVFVNEKCFWGIVKDLNLDKQTETMDVSLEHVITEWEYRQISVNHAVGDGQINVIYKGDTVEKSEQNNEGITANNFTLTVKEAKSAKDSLLIKKAHAQAWVLTNGDSIEVLVNKSKLKAKEGTYNIVFSTAKGTKITVEAEVKANVTYGKSRKKKDKRTGETIQAKDFKVSIDNLSEIDEDDELITVAKATAWKTGDKKEKRDIVSVTSNIQEAVGDYQVVFATANGTSITIVVSVTTGGSSDLEPSVIDEIEDIFNDNNFAYAGWQIVYPKNEGVQTVDYVYSRQNKLDALTKTMELTEDLFWRIGFTNQKIVEVGSFGDIKPWIVSTKESGKTNIKMLTEPIVDYDFGNVVNVATVYSEKSDSGMSSMTLRDVYNEEVGSEFGPVEDFPIIILRGDVNNERDYSQYAGPQYPKLAPNNSTEYSILDLTSIGYESGKLIEGTFAFNDLGPFNTESKQITDEKRKRAAKQAYDAAVRKLKQSRRTVSIEVGTEMLPPEINVGDKVRVMYANKILKLGNCSRYFKKIMTMDEYYYIQKISYQIDRRGQETNVLTLVKELKVDRETIIE